MDKQQLINAALRVIQSQQQRIAILEALEKNVLYEFSNRIQNWNAMGNVWKYLGRVRTFNQNSVLFDVFACTQDMLRNQGEILPCLSLSYEPIVDLKPVQVCDLALYVDWKFKSLAFERLINGTSKLRFKGIK